MLGCCFKPAMADQVNKLVLLIAKPLAQLLGNANCGNALDNKASNLIPKPLAHCDSEQCFGCLDLPTKFAACFLAPPLC